MTSTFRGCAVGIVASLAIVAVADGPFAGQTPVNPDAKILADFNDRVKAYVALRNKADDDAPKLKETKDAAKIQEAQLALAAAIRHARATARQGDIFAPEIEKKFRALLSPEVKGPAGAKAKATILEEKPMVELKVNTEYPSAEPLSTVPPTVLQAMPLLPKGEGLEYRFVRKHLILLDTRANLIVDFLMNAIP